MAGAGAHHGQDLINQVLRIGFGSLATLWLGNVFVAEILPQNGGHRFGGKDVVRHASGYRTARHAIEFCGFGVLNQNQPPSRPHLFQPVGPVASGSRQHDCNDPFALIGSKRPEQHIHRVAVPAPFRGLYQVQDTPRYCQISVRSDDIDMVALDLHLILDLDHGHCGVCCQHPRHLAFAGGIKVQNQNKGCTAVIGHRIEKLAERFDPPCGCAHSDDQTAIIDSCPGIGVRHGVRRSFDRKIFCGH